MIKANELRIGNKILFNNFIEPQKIVTIDARFFSSLAGGRNGIELKPDEEISNYYSPIPLTPEILEKAGFEKDKEEHAYKKGVLILGRIRDGIFGQCRFELISSDYTPELEYLHELQNLYFALTGEELMIEDLTKTT